MNHPLETYDLLLFDVDGTLRRCIAHSTPTTHAPCHNDPGQWEIIPGVVEVLARYDWSRVGFGLCSNQGGVGLGFTDAVTVERELNRLVAMLFPRWPVTTMVDGIYQSMECPRHRLPERGPVYRYAPAAPDASSADRKPSPWMLLDVVRAFQGRLDTTLYVGDSDIDAEAAARAGVSFVPAWEFFGWPPQDLNAQRFDTPR